MLKKLLKRFKLIFLSPVKSAIWYMLIWIVVTQAMFVVSNYVLVSTLTLFLCFMLIYPVYTFAECFMYAKRNGITWYMPFSMLLIVIVEFIVVTDFRSITPNIIVVTILCMLFGSGIGNVFADKEMLRLRKQEYEIKKNNEDKKYKKILDD